MFKEIPVEDRKEKRGSTRRRIYSKGINDAPYQTTIKVGTKVLTCPYFAKWSFMMYRCYSKGWLEKNPSYVGCTVCPEWMSFMAFRNWMMKQNWEGKQLDKDLLSLGKKVYSPGTCLFVTPQENSLFGGRGITPGELPPGVYARKGKYEVGVSLGDAKRTWIGAYNTVPEAIDAYIAAKKIAVKKVTSICSDPQVRDAIKKYADFYYDNLTRLKTAY